MQIIRILDESCLPASDDFGLAVGPCGGGHNLVVQAGEIRPLGRETCIEGEIDAAEQSTEPREGFNEGQPEVSAVEVPQHIRVEDFPQCEYDTVHQNAHPDSPSKNQSPAICVTSRPS